MSARDVGAYVYKSDWKCDKGCQHMVVNSTQHKAQGMLPPFVVWRISNVLMGPDEVTRRGDRQQPRDEAHERMIVIAAYRYRYLVSNSTPSRQAFASFPGHLCSIRHNCLALCNNVFLIAHKALFGFKLLASFDN